MPTEIREPRTKFEEMTREGNLPVPRSPEELEEILRELIRGLSNRDEDLELIPQLFMMAAQRDWHPNTVVKWAERLGFKFVTVDSWNSDPCIGGVYTEPSASEIYRRMVKLWKWKRYRKTGWLSGETHAVTLAYDPEWRKLIVFKETSSGSFSESSGWTAIGIWPPGGVKIKRTSWDVVCGPDGYETEREKVVEL